MYIKLNTEAEQEQIVRALRGWQFIRTKPGSLFDQGCSDLANGRGRDPHYGGVGGDSGPRVDNLTKEEVAEYLAGYEYHERYGW